MTAKDNTDNNEFIREMDDIVRLKPRNRVVHSRPRPSPRPQPGAEHEAEPRNPQSAAPVHLTDPENFRRSGVQNKLFRRLKRGQLPVEDILDLHGMRAEIADSTLRDYIERAYDDNLRCVCIVTGKGLRSPDSRSVLRPLTANLLASSPRILAFCPALPGDGGAGAFYVLLKANPQQD